MIAPGLSGGEGGSYVCTMKLAPQDWDFLLCAGEGASNVIPDSVSMAGTLRALTNSHFVHMRKRVTKVHLPSVLCNMHTCTPFPLLESPLESHTFGTLQKTQVHP